jgi:hypothetical protein
MKPKVAVLADIKAGEEKKKKEKKQIGSEKPRADRSDEVGRWDCSGDLE